MSQRELVRANGVEFYVEVSGRDGPQPIGVDEILSFDGVRETIEAIATELNNAWAKVRPSEASVEFGLAMTAKAGKLTGLVVEGGSTASLKVTLSWRSPDSTGAK